MGGRRRKVPIFSTPRQRVEEAINIRCGHLQLAVGLGLSRGDLRHGLVFRQAERDGQPRLLDDALPQLVRPQLAVVEAVHARKVEVMLVDRHLLVDRRAVGDDVGHETRITAIELHVATDEHRLRTQLPRHAHRHGRMHAELSCLIAARRHHAAVRHAAHDDGFPVKRRVHQPLHRHEEGVQIQV